MLPLDPNYKSTAPLQVQQLSCLQEMLNNNYDPYAPHSQNQEICRMLEAIASDNSTTIHIQPEASSAPGAP